MATKKRAQSTERVIPAEVIDPNTKIIYQKGSWLGKGGFARCYELIEKLPGGPDRTYAGKIVPKSLLARFRNRDKMTFEILVHQELNHKHIVGFYTYFEDEYNVYVLLELCRNHSLMEIQKRRKAITEPEVRYYLKQIVEACIYLHGRNIIHRDLKLGNIFINDKMELKVGDFGLAAKLEFSGQTKKTICGTPNYMAPEILLKKGHSFEVDIWSVGCILFTLLVGYPPFETQKLDDTYARIKKNDFTIPDRISKPARDLISRMLAADPANRPTMKQVLQHDFFTKGCLPDSLPPSCLTMEPRSLNHVTRRPLSEINVPKTRPSLGVAPEDAPPDAVPQDYWMSELHQQLSNLIAAWGPAGITSKITDNNDHAEDPSQSPVVWISKWVDYSDRYGLGYQLNDGSLGVLFNDSTKVLTYSDGENMQYVDREGIEHYFALKDPPVNTKKKVVLMEYFRNYMQENLTKTGENFVPGDTTSMQRLPWMRSWFRSRSAINMHLTNGSLQINFFNDHMKMILCPLMHAVTVFYPDKTVRTFKMSSLAEKGGTKWLQERVQYARLICDRMMQSKNTGSGKVLEDAYQAA